MAMKRGEGKRETKKKREKKRVMSDLWTDQNDFYTLAIIENRQLTLSPCPKDHPGAAPLAPVLRLDWIFDLLLFMFPGPLVNVEIFGFFSFLLFMFL